jgi:hypothetical protein
MGVHGLLIEKMIGEGVAEDKHVTPDYGLLGRDAL